MLAASMQLPARLHYFSASCAKTIGLFCTMTPIIVFYLARRAITPDEPAAITAKAPFRGCVRTEKHALVRPCLHTRKPLGLNDGYFATSFMSPPFLVEGNPTAFMQNTSQKSCRKILATPGFAGNNIFPAPSSENKTRQKSPAGQINGKQVKAEPLIYKDSLICR